VRLLFGVLSILLGLLLLAHPPLLAERFKAPGDAGEAFRAATVGLSIGVAVAFTVFGAASLLWQRSLSLWQGANGLWWRTALCSVATCVAYLAIVQPLSWWMIDDAAITFAYSENLVLGHGLTLHPNLPPEEGYSNTLWMLWLAALRYLGIAIPVVAKVSCIVIGVVTVAAVHAATLKLIESARSDADQAGASERAQYPWLVPTVLLLSAPYLVWSVSGLEHGLQGLAILGAAAFGLFTTRYVVPVALCHCALVLIRPEAPLIVASSFAVYVCYARAAGSTWVGAIKSQLLIALIPALVWAGLIAFRLAYFGDPLPNPFYAKAGDATFIRIFNVVGGGWDYLLSWAFGSGVVVVIPFIARRFQKALPLAIAVGLAQLVAHFAFVLYAAGDWMGCWRFVSPAIPTLAMIAGWAYHHELLGPLPEAESTAGAGSTVTRGAVVRAAVMTATIGLLGVGSTKQYLAFVSAPTTPYTVVAAIGERFVELAARLGKKDPILAHHDAGGTSYNAGIQLLDLGGLGSRTVAKHWHDAEFLSHYVLEEVKPDFVFGVANNFAAGYSLFWQRPKFKADYVRVEFPGAPHMVSDLCHVRRELVEGRALPAGITLAMEDGALAKVVVR
jgi:hypothetical protein